MTTELLDPPRASGPRMDPRFAQRRFEVRREEGRRRLRIVLVVASVVVAGLVVVGALYSPLFAVRHVGISLAGSGPVGAGEIRSLAGLDGHRLMMDIDGGRIAARLDEDPWLADARVQVAWPSTVTISATQRQPLAQVKVEGTGWAEIDVTGRVLARSASRFPRLPGLETSRPVPAPGRWISGSPGPAAPVSGVAPAVDVNADADSPDVPQGTTAALAALELLPAKVRSKVTSAGVASSTGLTLRLAAPGAPGGVTVSLGDGSELAAKMAALATLAAHRDLSAALSVDLTVPSRPAVTPS